MSETPDVATGMTADRLYCERLVEVAFPFTVWIESVSYGKEELRTALQADAGVRRRAAKKYGSDPDNSTNDDLIAMAFPATVEIDGSTFERDKLYEALLISPKLRQLVAEKFHYDSDELYWERLIEVAFQKKKEKKHESARIGSRSYKDADALRRALQNGSQSFREKVGKDCGYPRSKWMLEMYCRRLLEVAFPSTVEIEGKSLDRNKLSTALENDEDLRQRIAVKHSSHPELLKTNELIEKIFPATIDIGGKHYSKDDLLVVLPSNPKLQQQLAAKSYFTPSKWLVEKEMQVRGVWTGDPASEDIYKIVAENWLTGVCFSGGGIRSATFNLGVLQGLAQLGLLPNIDYLSSVSGGGYIHEFLAGWILRNGNQAQVIEELIPQAEPGCLPRAPEPIEWLKKYSSYLTPARGLFSTDTWTAFAIWLRNTILNQIPILTAFACAFFLVHLIEPRPIESWHPGLRHGEVLGLRGWVASGLALLLYSVLSVCILWRNLHRQELRAATGEGAVEDLLTNGAVVRWVIMPWLGCSVWVSYWVQMPSAHKSLPYWLPIGLLALLILATVEAVIFAGGTRRAYKSLNPEARRWRKGWAWIGFAAGGVVATAVSLVLGWAGMEATRWGSIAISKWIHATLGANNGVAALIIDAWRIRLVMLPGVLLSVPYVAIELTLGLLGRDYWIMRREWLARLRAWSMLYALVWAGGVALVLLGPYVGYYIEYKGLAWIWSSLIAFLAAHGATIFAGWSGKSDGKPTQSGFLGFKPMDLLALVAAPVAIVTLLLLLSFAASVTVDKSARLVQTEVCAMTSVSSVQCQSDNLATTIPSSKEFIFADSVCLLTMLSVAVLLGWRVDINEFSMHSFYKNRLSRSYLGAAISGQRQPDPFTGFDDRSRVRTAGGQMRDYPPRVRDLLPLGYRKATGEAGLYDGPFPIFCTTLNLTTGEDLATQERKGTSFAFTPLYSGYSVAWTDGQPNNAVSFNGYVPTDEYAYRNGGIHLDSAVAISGAALNPNQGYNSNPALAFLMTFFNVRLGWWISNTRKMDTWPAANGRSTPRFALIHLLKELFGKVGDGTKYLNLSDGGHFENMGLYELVRRRCSYIIVCDAEDDPEMKFEGMGAAITKCRADFGAEIDLDLRPLRKQEDTQYSKVHCVVGTIRYPRPPGEGARANTAVTCKDMGNESDDAYTGVIVYMKSSLVGDEPADLLTHQLKCAEFPQDSTANQWFTETLFEAYRRLGHHITMTTIRPALSPLETRVNGRKDIPELFDRMYAIWYPRTPEMEKYLGDHLRQYEDFLKELRKRKELVDLEDRLNDPRRTVELEKRRNPRDISGSADLPFVKWSAPQDVAESGQYATQFADSVLGFMYTVYTNLQLAFPDNRVSPHAEWWICLFRRWCRVDLLQDTWIAHESVYTEEFRLFAIRELRLP
jgi:hypothetical protein